MKALHQLGSGAKVALGAALASLGGLLLVLSPVVGWHTLPGPWAFPLGFSTGLLAGFGMLLAIGGLTDGEHTR